MKDELDRILDDALASYSAQEPRVGLAGRVMARVRSEGERTRRIWLLPAIAMAAAACVAIAMMLWRSDSATRPIVIAPVGPVIVKKVEQPPASLRPAVPRRVEHPQHAARLPQRERFPSPDPLTPGERALLAFVQHSPEAARQLAQPGKPLEIEAISIRPIEIDGLEIGEIR